MLWVTRVTWSWPACEIHSHCILCLFVYTIYLHEQTHKNCVFMFYFIFLFRFWIWFILFDCLFMRSSMCAFYMIRYFCCETFATLFIWVYSFCSKLRIFSVSVDALKISSANGDDIAIVLGVGCFCHQCRLCISKSWEWTVNGGKCQVKKKIHTLTRVNRWSSRWLKQTSHFSILRCYKINNACELRMCDWSRMRVRVIIIGR